MEPIDIRELTFQNVLDTILKPAGVKVGGFPPEMFNDLEESDSERWMCNICYLVVNGARQCDNKHLFCHTCVFAWTLTYGENSQKCPFCRCDQREYAPNKEVDLMIQDKRVHCMEEGCTFKSPLKIFLMHSHGKLQFSNAHIELESLRPRQRSARFLIMPTLGLVGPAAGSAGPQIRYQLLQGRAMINQMMTLLHLEMQLRQQSLISFRAAAEPAVRQQRFDEVLALNEQLNEVGTILSSLLHSPMTGPSTLLGERQAERLEASTSATPEDDSRPRMPVSRVSSLLHRFESGGSDDEDDSDTDTDSESSSTVSSASQQRPEATNNAQRRIASVLDRSPVSSLERTLNEGQAALERARERREISQQLLSQNMPPTDNHASTDDETATGPNILNRPPGTIPRVGQIQRSQQRPNAVRLSQMSTAPASRPIQSDDTTVARIGGSIAHAPESEVLPQLPDITSVAHSTSTTSQALAALSTPSRDPSRQDTPSPVESEPPSTVIPQGSLALRQAMQAMTRSVTPRRLSIDNSPAARNTSPRSPSTRPQQDDPGTFTSTTGLVSSLLSSQVSTRQALATAQTESRSTLRPLRSPSLGRTADNRRIPVRADNIAHESLTSQEVRGTNNSGSILPASLYRRRDRSAGTSRTQGEAVQTDTRPLVTQNAPREPRSLPARQKTMISANIQPQSRRNAAPPARATTRLNPLPNRPVINRQTSTQSQSSGVSHLSSETSTRSTGVRPQPGDNTRAPATGGLPRLPDGRIRPRRNSEIRQNLLTRK